MTPILMSDIFVIIYEDYGVEPYDLTLYIEDKSDEIIDKIYSEVDNDFTEKQKNDFLELSVYKERLQQPAKLLEDFTTRFQRKNLNKRHNYKILEMLISQIVETVTNYQLLKAIKNASNVAQTKIGKKISYTSTLNLPLLDIQMN